MIGRGRHFAESVQQGFAWHNWMVSVEQVDQLDLAVVAEQLGRPPRGVAGVAWRCPGGWPGVVLTSPRLPPDNSPFPTTYYLTCPVAVAGCSRLEASGVMAMMTAQLAVDAELRRQYLEAHRAYLGARAGLAVRLGVDDVPRANVSAGGMPDRVKCLHALVGQSLAVGSGVNPLGDQALQELGPFWDGCQICGELS